jgi:DNA-directed RNA polymerase subunit H (RpoH/RPB5)
MLANRGYSTILENQPSHILVSNDKEDRIIVFVDDNVKLNKNTMTKCMTVMKGLGINHCIIIYTETVTTMTMKSIEDTFDFEFEIFSKDELQFDITKHVLQPKSFRALGSKENTRFRSEYGMKFPVMRKTDPVARYYNYRKGDIVEITDKRDLIYYRIVR